MGFALHTVKDGKDYLSKFLVGPGKTIVHNIRRYQFDQQQTDHHQGVQVDGISIRILVTATRLKMYEIDHYDALLTDLSSTHTINCVKFFTFITSINNILFTAMSSLSIEFSGVGLRGPWPITPAWNTDECRCANMVLVTCKNGNYLDCTCRQNRGVEISETNLWDTYFLRYTRVTFQ